VILLFYIFLKHSAIRKDKLMDVFFNFGSIFAVLG